MNIFVPFIESYITTSTIVNVFKNQNFGEVISIQLHDKKIKTKNNLKSAKHNYAFITVKLYDSVQGKNMRENLLYNKTTHIMFEYNQKVQHLQIKPHLTVEDRLERGFELHIPNIDICEQNSNNDIKKETKEDDKPEWFNDISSSMFSFDFKKSMKNLSLSLPEMNISDILNKGEMAPRTKTPSFYNDIFEKEELIKDFNDTMDEVELERLNYQHYISLLV